MSSHEMPMPRDVKWLVKFQKGNDKFVLPFNHIDDMIMACARAGKVGYTYQTLKMKTPKGKG